MSVDEGQNVRLDLKNVLWRTRGQHWDYSFVLRPVFPRVDSWYDVHVKVFAGISPDIVPVNRGGILVLDSEKHRFVATAFQDARRRDAADRPVANYIIWFPSIVGNETSGLSVPLSWGEQVASSLGAARAKTFNVLPSELVDGASVDLEGVFASARDASKQISLNGGLVPVTFDDVTVGVEKKKPLATTSQSKWSMLAGTATVVLLLLALLWYASR